MDYFERTEGKKFNEMVNDPEFQSDLIKFFTSSRYNYSKEDIMELGPEGLTDEFIEHMRWQGSNEATIAIDYNFVKNAEKDDEDGLMAFGRLTQAWDRSEGAGTGFLDGAVDYGTAILASPSTAATVLTAGLGGPVAKFIGAGSRQAASLGVRKLLMNGIGRQAAANGIKQVAKESGKKAMLKGGAIGLGIEGTLGGATALGQEEVREVAIPEYEKDLGNVAIAAAISGGIGGGLGAFSRRLSMKKQGQALDILETQGSRMKASEVEAAKKAKDTLDAAAKANKGSPEEAKYKYLKDRITTTVQLIKSRDEGKIRKQFLAPLDEELVERGASIKAKVFDGPEDDLVTGRLTTGTFKKIAAATLDVAEAGKFKLEPGVRVTESVRKALDDGTVNATRLEEIRKKYNLTKSDFGLVFLSDMSEAGRTLNFASQVKRGLSKVEAKEAAKKAKESFDSIVSDLESFGQKGIINPADEALEKLERNLKSGRVVSALREADSFRIGMMTTQLATTAANVGSSLARIGTDFSDRIFLNVLEGRMPFKDTLAIVRGLSYGKQDAHVLRILAEADPESDVARIFNDISRIETETGRSGVTSTVVRGFNFLNNLVDTQFKEATFYASIQRQLSDRGDEALGKSVKDYLKGSIGLETLEEVAPETVQKARRDALSFSYQYGYEGSDNPFGKFSNSVIRLNKQVPFLISGGVGMPFPRYIANQMEYIHRHMPTGLAEGLWEKISGNTPVGVGPTSNEKIAQGVTGTLMMLGAIAQRLYADPSTSYRETIDPVSGNTVDLSRIAGPYMGHYFIGDMIARKIKGEPVFSTGVENATEALEVLTGLNGYGFQGTTIRAVQESVEKGELTPGVERWLADIVATLTMPAATVRDFQGQFDVEATPTPYTRNVMVSQDRVVSGDTTPGFGESEFAQRASRFLPDFDFVQYASSFNGRKDIPLYGGFNEKPVQKVNPMLSQILGVDIKPKKNSLETEMQRLNLKPYVILGSRTIKNPNIDLAVREVASKTLPQRFLEFSQEAVLTGGRTYDMLPEDEKRQHLERFLKASIRAIEDDVQGKFTEFAANNPRSAMGFILNNYEIEARKYRDKFTKMKDVITYGTGNIQTEEEYLDDAESVSDRLLRMQNILIWAKELESKNKELYKID